MIGYEHNKDDKADYAKLYKLLQDKQMITPDNNNANALKGVIAGAAIHYFSFLHPQKQFEVVAGYLKDVGLL